MFVMYYTAYCFAESNTSIGTTRSNVFSNYKTIEMNVFNDFFLFFTGESTSEDQYFS